MGIEDILAASGATAEPAKDIGRVPDSTEPELRRFLAHMREAVQELAGNRGDSRNAAVRWADMIERGYSDRQGFPAFSGAAATPPNESDPTPPPTPTGLTVTAGITRVILQWDVAVYLQGHGPRETRIYAVQKDPSDPTLPTFPGSAGLVESVSHPGVIAVLASDPGIRWHLWITFVTADGYESVVPCGGPNGISTTTGQDPAALLAVLEGHLTESQLAAALAARIALVDGAGAGSVTARLATLQASVQGTIDTEVSALQTADGLAQTALAAEVDARQIADAATSGATAAAGLAAGGTMAALLAQAQAQGDTQTAVSTRVDTLANVLGNNVAAQQTEQTTRVDADSAMAAQMVALAAATGQGLAAVVSEAAARVDGDTSTASQVASLIATFATGGTGDPVNAAALLTEQQVRADADTALAQQTTTLSASAAGNAAALQVEQTARADADSATTTQLLTLSTSVGLASSAVAQEAQSRTDADGAMASLTTSLVASIGTTSAAVQAEQDARASDNAASASQVASLAASMGTGSASTAAAITAEQLARVDADSATASQTSAIAAAAGGLQSAITSASNTTADQTQALATTVSTVQAVAAAGVAVQQVEQQARVDGDGAAATQTATLATSTASTAAALTVEQQARSDAYAATAAVASGLAASTASTAGAITTEQLVRAADSSAAAALSSAVSAAMASALAAISQEQTTRADNDTAVASNVTTLTARLSGLGGSGVSIETNATATASTLTGLSAQYTVKIDASGYVTGYGLASTVVNGVPTSEFVIRADQFAVAPVQTDNTAADGSPFFYRTVPTVINGVTVPAGGYLKAAYIHDATITNAKIADAAIDDAKIANLSAAKITTGTLSADRIAANSITAGKIDARGLRILSPDGTVILSSEYSAAGAVNLLPFAQSVISAGPGNYGGASGYVITPAMMAAAGIVAGDIITLSADVWADAEAASHGYSSTAYLNDPTWAWGINKGAPGTSRTRVVVTGVVDAAAVSNGIYSTVYRQPSGGGMEGSVYMDRVKIERGPVATPFSPGAEPGATAGATFGVNIGGQITAANASTYIAAAAIGLAHINTASIGSLSALSANLGTVTAGTLTAVTLNGAIGTFSGRLTAAAIDAVDTINIAGNAVTIPDGAYTAGAVSITNTTVHIQTSPSITTDSGVPVAVFAGFLVHIFDSALSELSSTSGSISAVLTRGATELIRLDFPRIQYGVINFPPFVDSVGGSNIYRIKIYTSGISGGVSVSAMCRGIFFAGMKK